MNPSHTDLPLAPRIIPRSEHNLSRSNISENATKVLYRLKKAGYDAYLVGGGVRDLLLGRQPKDFDVATNALPEEVQALFSNCRLIGRRFRLAHVHFRGDIVEVATFRATPGDSEEDEFAGEGRILRDNVYGTIDEDAWRRDFTVNALYYNIRDFSVVSYAGGMEDLEHGILRLIGDPPLRYREDPVRMLRAVRFATKLGFRLEPATEAPIHELAYLLEDIPAARLFDEVLKLFHGGFALQNFEMLRNLGLFRHLFPEADQALDRAPGSPETELVIHGLAGTDSRIAAEQSVTPAFLFAVLLWPCYRHELQGLLEEGVAPYPAMQEAGDRVLMRQSLRVTIPKRFSYPAREIWMHQSRLEQTRGKRPMRLLENARFRAAYDFLLLRAGSGEDVAELCDWWTRFQEVTDSERFHMTSAKGGAQKKRRRRRRGSKDAAS